MARERCNAAQYKGSRISDTEAIQRGPDLICIGATKAGTSWLFQNLSANPAVWRGPIKKVNAIPEAFAHERLAWTKNYLRRQMEMLEKRGGARKLGWDAGVYHSYVEGLRQYDRQDASWYDAVFSIAPEDQALVDVSLSYGPMPKDAVAFWPTLAQLRRSFISCVTLFHGPYRMCACWPRGLRAT